MDGLISSRQNRKRGRDQYFSAFSSVSRFDNLDWGNNGAFSEMPDDTIEHFISMLPVFEQLRAREVCRRWQAIVERGMKELVLIGCGQSLTADNASTFCQRFTNVRTLHFEDFRDASDYHFAQICTSFPQLTALQVSGCVDLTEESVRHIANGSPLLETLIMTENALPMHGSLYTDKAMQYLADGCKYLRKLSTRADNITDTGLMYLAQSCKQLRVPISYNIS